MNRAFMLLGSVLPLLVARDISVSPADQAKPNEEAESLIDELVKVSEAGFGYSGYFSGSEFLPNEETGEIRTLVLGAGQRSRSETLRKIVEHGVDAVPSLLEHLDDDRRISIKPMKGMMWMDFSDKYDFNRRTRKEPPEGVNRDTFGREENHPSEHAVTVADLCFVGEQTGTLMNSEGEGNRAREDGRKGGDERSRKGGREE